MNAHTFTSAAGSKGACDVCGKTRNAKAHKLAKAVDAQVDAATEANMAAEAEVAANAEALVNELLDEDFAAADTRTNEQVEADAAQAEHDQVEHDNAAEADLSFSDAARLDAGEAAVAEVAPAKAKKDTAALWVGWRIAEAVTGDSTLAAKIREAKPTADRDRTVRLTVAELQELDTVAERFQKEGKTGPEIYSGRALRGRINAAIAKIEENNK
jgi:hypothetical protein